MKQLERAFAQWQAAVSAHEEARLALVAAIRNAVKTGTSQSEVASVLEWPRQRVNKLL